jgi:hypothetical protein
MHTTVAMPVWFAPTIGSPNAIKKAAVRQVSIPSARMMFFQFVTIFPPLFIYHILLTISNFMLDIVNIRYLRLTEKLHQQKQKSNQKSETSR